MGWGMERFLWICVAGGLGTGSRYLIGLWTERHWGSGFPYGTLLVNVVGCFLIALVMKVATQSPLFPPNLRLALATGFIGGFTTYSSFNYEATALLQAGARGTALVYCGLTLLLCFVAGVMGLDLGARLANA